MTDDFDDEFDPEAPPGRILHSGIQRRFERAGYALPVGGVALEGGDPEFAIVESNFSRRRLLALGIGAAGFAATGTAVGWLCARNTAAKDVRPPPATNATADDPAETEAMLGLARRFARGSFEQLVNVHATYIWIVDNHGQSDPELVDGLVRLAKFAILDRGDRGYSIARQMTQAWGLHVPPAKLLTHYPALENLVRVRRRRGR